MPPHGRRHRLVLYTYMLNRWWRYTLGIGIVMLILAALLAFLPIWLPRYQILWVPDRTLWVVAGSGGYALVLSIFLVTIRKLSYIQPFPAHLLLITPFLRLHIAYRRIRKISSVEMAHLFPIGKFKGVQRKLLSPLANETATVLEMRGWPLPRWVLDLFLSPLFFPDKTPRLALLVPDWMDFSMDLESFRSTWLDSLNQPESSPQWDLLTSITKSTK
jgi:hypothetical protein